MGARDRVVVKAVIRERTEISKKFGNLFQDKGKGVGIAT